MQAERTPSHKQAHLAKGKKIELVVLPLLAGSWLGSSGADSGGWAESVAGAELEFVVELKSAAAPAPAGACEPSPSPVLPLLVVAWVRLW